MNGHKRPLKVAVVGGGICGLAAAIGLSRAGVDVDLYESAVSSSLPVLWLGLS